MEVEKMFDKEIIGILINIDNVEEARLKGVTHKKLLIDELKYRRIEVDSLVKRGLIPQRTPDIALIRVNIRECGSSIIYRTYDELPDTSVPCSCGNPNHWFIKYTEEGTKIV